ncbi:YcgL domain-containing protein [Pokkaliibacter sp. MBI-7]|uniref:YcgL domain-containing protein n=1 Tax=Pokkaliibacter sp. MBI-7 TaxID=3040600 RepID=UPI00244AB443|nr:YcgL domain-containing protein [Pokkaliibacter sp. MBI-7]MDH2435020.1 YcgL domain-containing protein [Pokkaliibacter sp. MBI-7]
MKPVLCSIYKSPKRDEMYLYVLKQEQFAKVPELLLEQFGKPVHVFDMLLKADRKLARAKVEDVLAAIESQGFFLQMPPPKEAYMLDNYRAPTEGRY